MPVSKNKRGQKRKANLAKAAEIHPVPHPGHPGNSGSMFRPGTDAGDRGDADPRHHCRDPGADTEHSGADSNAGTNGNDNPFTHVDPGDETQGHVRTNSNSRRRTGHSGGSVVNTILHTHHHPGDHHGRHVGGHP